jgi:hypothetical protein
MEDVKQVQFGSTDKGPEKADENLEPLSEIEDPTERKLERLKRNYEPLTN